MTTEISQYPPYSLVASGSIVVAMFLAAWKEMSWSVFRAIVIVLFAGNLLSVIMQSLSAAEAASLLAQLLALSFGLVIFIAVIRRLLVAAGRVGQNAGQKLGNWIMRPPRK